LSSLAEGNKIHCYLSAIPPSGVVKCTMAPIKWDAYRTLNITNRDSGGMTCVGNTRYGKRCRWDIPDKKFSQICSILDEFETKAPANAMSSLKRLAQLSLCEEYHQGQAFEKIDEWEVAIQEATQFYESGKGLKEKNRELKEMLKEERSEREELERKFEAEMSRRKQELKSISSMSIEVSSMRAKLKQSETEARDSKEVAQKMSKSYDKCVAEMEERVSILRAEWNDKHQNMTTTLQKEAQTVRSISSELKKLKASEIILVNQVSELTLQLKTELHANSTLQSELIQIKSERDSALSQKDEFKSQLEIAAEKIDRIGFSLQKVEADRDTISEEKQRLHARLSIKNQNLKDISDAKAQLEEKYTGLAQEVGTLNAQLSSERQNAAELRQSLQTATGNLSSTHTQLRAVKEDLSHNKDELEKLQVEFAKVRGDFEEERLKLSMHQAASLTRIDELIQEMTYAKLHPFRTFFVNLFEATISWVKPVFVCFGRLRRRKALNLPTMEENMPSP
jgi:chromosome segregation ATPase